MRALPEPLRKSEGQWHAEKHCRLKRVIPRSFPQSNLRQTSLDAREAKLSNHVRQVIYSKLRSIAARTSALYRKLSPDGWPLRILHFLAESGVVLHSLMRLFSADCWCSARIPSVLIFFMKYSASATAVSSM